MFRRHLRQQLKEAEPLQLWLDDVDDETRAIANEFIDAKNAVLAQSGPYSVVRNPLYLGNFLGLLGFLFAVQQPLLALALAGGFAFLYPAVVRAEEARLAALFGERYAAYCASVPRWVPDWSRYREPETVTIRPPEVRKAILDAMWFLWAFALWEFVEELHKLQLLPTLF